MLRRLTGRRWGLTDVAGQLDGLWVWGADDGYYISEKVGRPLTLSGGDSGGTSTPSGLLHNGADYWEFDGLCLWWSGSEFVITQGLGIGAFEWLETTTTRAMVGDPDRISTTVTKTWRGDVWWSCATLTGEYAPRGAGKEPPLITVDDVAQPRDDSAVRPGMTVSDAGVQGWFSPSEAGLYTPVEGSGLSSNKYIGWRTLRAGSGQGALFYERPTHGVDPWFQGTDAAIWNGLVTTTSLNASTGLPESVTELRWILSPARRSKPFSAPTPPDPQTNPPTNNSKGFWALPAASYTGGPPVGDYELVWPYVPPVFKKLTVDGGLGSDTFQPGDLVAIQASEPEDGKEFSTWDPPSLVADPLALSTTLEMPDVDTTVRAVYSDLPLWSLTVQGGSGSGSYYEGAVVAVSADAAAEGLMFLKWTGGSGAVDRPRMTSASVTMPAGDVVLTALYADAPESDQSLYVDGGEGSGDYAAGLEVPVSAASFKDGSPFLRWTGSTATLSDPYAASTTIRIPSGGASLKALYGDPPAASRLLSVWRGSGSGWYDEGSTAALTADAAPEHKVFDKWVGDVDALADASLPSTTAAIGGRDISVAASYKMLPEPLPPTPETVSVSLAGYSMDSMRDGSSYTVMDYQVVSVVPLWL